MLYETALESDIFAYGLLENLSKCATLPAHRASVEVLDFGQFPTAQRPSKRAVDLSQAKPLPPASHFADEDLHYYGTEYYHPYVGSSGTVLLTDGAAALLEAWGQADFFERVASLCATLKQTGSGNYLGIDLERTQGRGSFGDGSGDTIFEEHYTLHLKADLALHCVWDEMLGAWVLMLASEY